VATPIDSYLALCRETHACLLESVDRSDRLARRSFIGLDYHSARSFEATPALYDQLREFVLSQRVEAEHAALGGGLIVLAYDAARPAARLAPRAQSAPAAPAAFAAVPATWLIFDHLAQSLTIWASGDSPAALERRIDDYLERIFSHPPAAAQPIAGRGPVGQSIDRESYLTLARRVKQHVYEGDVYQLQLGIRFCADLNGSAFDLYRALRRRNPSPYMFFIDTPFGELLGASPELLVRLDGKLARIRPLAGTRPRGRDDREDACIASDLLSDEKERAEHVMLVDLGRNDLGSVCEFGTVCVDELLQIERYSHVMHIVSDVAGRLREGYDALDLLRAGFPAGTVTGTPKIRAMQIIDELEPVTRGFYAGSVGRLAFDGDFDSCIALRGVHAQNGRAWWQASAGIVADSDPAAEYDEVLHKTRIIREVLGL
jgi:anthranilate synthase component I